MKKKSVSHTGNKVQRPRPPQIKTSINNNYKCYHFDLNILSDLIESTKHEECINIFLSILYDKQLNNIKNFNKQHKVKFKNYIKYTKLNDYSDELFSHIPARSLSRLLLNHDKIINVLIKHRYLYLRIIEDTNFGNSINVYFINTDKLVRSNIKHYIQSDANKKKLNTLYKHYKDVLKEYIPLYEMQKDFKILITKKQFIDEIYKKYLNLPKINNKRYFINDNNEEIPCSFINYLYRRYSSYEDIVNFNNLPDKFKTMYFKVDNFSGRFHSIFTRIPSFCRKYVYYNNIQMNMELDLKTSQFTILASLLKSNYTFRKNIDLFELYSNYYCEDFKTDNFINDVENKDIYIEYGKMIDDNFNSNKRNDYKRRLFSIIFGTINNKEFYNFEKTYKTTSYMIKIIKTEPLYYFRRNNKYKNLSKLLQTIEVNIFSSIWNEIINNKILFVNIHDSILFNKNDYDKINEIMNKILKEKLHIKYSLKTSKH